MAKPRHTTQNNSYTRQGQPTHSSTYEQFFGRKVSRTNVSTRGRSVKGSNGGLLHTSTTRVPRSGGLRKAVSRYKEVKIAWRDWGIELDIWN